MKILQSGPQKKSLNELLWALAGLEIMLALGARFIGPGWLAISRPWYLKCLFRQITGHYCPFCGMTRACVAALKGNFVQAWQENPLALVMLGCGLFILLWQPFANLARCHLPEKFWHYLGKCFWIFILLNWAYLFFSK